MVLENIGNIPGAIGWSVETSTGYTKSGAVIVPRIGDPFFGSDYLGLSRYGGSSGTDLNKLRDQLQAIIDETSPSPYQLTIDRIKKVLKDNIQNWNFLYPNGTSPKPRKWKESFGNDLQIIITQDGRLTFDRDWEPPHNHPKIHHMVDNVNYFVQQYSDKPYIVLMDHLKRLGKGWKTPDKGSLWHLIHTGDVNFARLSQFISKIPGLDVFLSQFGLSTDSLTKYAEQYLVPGGNAQNPTVPISPGEADEGSGGSAITKLLLPAVAGFGIYYTTKKPVYALAAAAATFLITSMSKTTSK